MASSKKAAEEFVGRWKTKEGSEDREARSFRIELCGEVLGVANPTHVLDFELLSVADIGFAMGNADEGLKAAADHILPDCTHPCVRGMLDYLTTVAAGESSGPCRSTR